MTPRDSDTRASSARRVCFVTGTRAEFGLMGGVLRAIQKHPRLSLQLVVTGMHLDRRHGRSVDQIMREGWRIDQIIPWRGAAAGAGAVEMAGSTGRAITAMASAFARLKSDIVLVVGDRVEAFAAAAAGHISGKVVAHVHGGDRALGQVDDSLRHAITKLAHVHFPATAASAERIGKLGEDAWRIHRVGSPGVDGIEKEAASRGALPQRFGELTPRRYALLVLHPADADEAVEYRRAKAVLRAVETSGFEQIVIVHPNNDPGTGGIQRCWTEAAKRPAGSRHSAKTVVIERDISRPLFLGLLRDAAVLAGNSSSGIIEAASFGTPVVNIGPRQLGRERSGNVIDVTYAAAAMRRALQSIWNHGSPRRAPSSNIYGGRGVGRKISGILGRIRLDGRMKRKLIAY
ncbi:MAG TPA: UDP-N-acetylglucosamine 2-epimerase [Tepidisphaeraceae bacterium]|jgi:UDP-hydrolysing UDP-N-acetyl-D-glucosamine 2-epimerase